MRLLILGNAPCLEAELAGVDLAGFVLMALNRSGLRVLDRLEYWATYHPEVMAAEQWREQRAARGGNGDYQTVIHRHADKTDFPDASIFSGATPSGSCALFGTLYGVHLGFHEIVLAGCPLKDDGYAKYRRGWEICASALRAHGGVSSMSGWTKNFLEGLNRGA